MRTGFDRLRWFAILIIHRIIYLSTANVWSISNSMLYHVGIGCSFGASQHNVHKLLAEHLGATFINLSESGTGNFRMYTELLYWISTNKEKLQDTTFSIGWSGIYRNDLIQDVDSHKKAFEWTRWRADKEDEVLRHLPTDMNISLDHYARFLTNVIATQNLFENVNCKYVMYNAIDTHVGRSKFTNDQNIHLNVLEKQIKQASFYNIKKSQCEFIAENKYFLDGSPMNNTNKIINWPSDDSQYSVQDAHPSEEGDRKWADLVWKFCLHNNLF